MANVEAGGGADEEAVLDDEEDDMTCMERVEELRRVLRGKWTLLFLVLLPLSLSCVLVIRGLVAQVNTLSSVEGVINGVDLVSAIADFVVENQRERIFSAMYQFYNGTQYATELSQERLTTDHSIARFRNTAKKYSLPGITDHPKLLSVLDDLSHIGQVRSDISSFQYILPVDDDYFTDMNEDCLAVIAKVATSASDPTVQRKLVVLYFWIFNIMHAGLERGSGVYAVAEKGWKDLHGLEKYVEFEAVEDLSLEAVFTFATESSMDLASQAVDSALHPVLQTDETLKSALELNNTAGFANLTVGQYYSIVTERIDIMTHTMLSLASDAVSATDPVKRNARTMVIIYSVLCAVVVAMLIVVVNFLRFEIKQMAEAENIAMLVSAMDLDQIGAKPASATPLQEVMYQIADNMRIIKPYLPPSLFAKDSASEGQDEDDESEVEEEGNDAKKGKTGSAKDKGSSTGRKSKDSGPKRISFDKVKKKKPLQPPNGSGTDGDNNANKLAKPINDRASAVSGESGDETDAIDHMHSSNEILPRKKPALRSPNVPARHHPMGKRVATVTSVVTSDSETYGRSSTNVVQVKSQPVDVLNVERIDSDTLSNPRSSHESSASPIDGIGEGSGGFRAASYRMTSADDQSITSGGSSTARTAQSKSLNLNESAATARSRSSARPSTSRSGGSDTSRSSKSRSASTFRTRSQSRHMSTYSGVSSHHSSATSHKFVSSANRAAKSSTAGIQNRIVTIMVVNVTRYHELLHPDHLMELYPFQSQFVALVEDVMKQTKGVIHRISGDRVLASWNAVNRIASHAPMGCKAALMLTSRFRSLECVLGSIIPHELHVSLSAGECLVGTVGSQTVQALTVLGNAIPTATKLNGLNKVLSTLVVADAAVRQAAQFSYRFRMVDKIQWTPGPVDSSRLVPIFELMSEFKRASKVDEEWMYTLQNQEATRTNAFEDGILAFFAGQLGKAAASFEMHCTANPEDLAAATFLRRSRACLGCLPSPPGQPSLQPPTPKKPVDVTDDQPPPPISPVAQTMYAYGRVWCGWGEEGEWDADLG